MTSNLSTFRVSLFAATMLAALAAPLPSLAADAAGAAKAGKAGKAAAAKAPTARKAAAKPVEAAPPPASAEQVDAAERVFYGIYDCEFNQTVNIEKSVTNASYVNVRSGKSSWVMKPVLSSTGAIRLEDVKGETLMVQIASKSMLLNVKTAHRIVDDCVSPKQRELIEAARVAKAAELAKAEAAKTEAAASAASSGSAVPVESTSASATAPASPAASAASAVK
jgi:hypothetical protein